MKDDYIFDKLWEVLGGSLMIIGALMALVFKGLWNKISGMERKLELKADRDEVIALEERITTELRDHSLDRARRDDVVDKKLGGIHEDVAATHRRIDDIYKHLTADRSGR